MLDHCGYWDGGRGEVGAAARRDSRLGSVNNTFIYRPGMCSDLLNKALFLCQRWTRNT